eukprot:TRINITY_DN23133_c0_g1_i2.p1 TRINITY_DN23133_c0_g1~~TRINITY_DN23133_c0_g1_i2.p1  ORF type:complete len:265 (-),score=26.98 TRINITY_DN23133_c0_g1_i2:254-1048(-)
MSLTTAVCGFCQRSLIQTAFNDRHWRKATGGEQSACCTQCRAGIEALREQACCLSEQRDGPTCSDDVTLENHHLWEEAADIVIAGLDDVLSLWLPTMLRRWLVKRRKEIEEPKHEVEQIEFVYPSWLAALRAERILSYDVDTYPFEKLFQDMFETPELAALHLLPPNADRPPLCPTLFRAYVNAGIKRPAAWKQSTRWEAKYVKRFRESPEYGRFLEVYHRFIKQVRPIAMPISPRTTGLRSTSGFQPRGCGDQTLCKLRANPA